MNGRYVNEISVRYFKRTWKNKGKSTETFRVVEIGQGTDIDFKDSSSLINVNFIGRS